MISLIKGKFKHLGNITSVRDKLFDNDVNFRIKEIWEDKKAKKVKNIDVKEDKKEDVKEEDKEPKITYPNTFDRKDNFYWDDFADKWGRHIFDSEEELVKTLTPEINRVCVFIKRGNCEIIKDDEDDLFYYSVGDDFNVKCFDKGRENLMNWNDIRKACYKGLRKYKRVFVDPNPKTASSAKNMKKFNLWTGFKAKLVDNIDMEKVNPILKHIKIVLANDEDDIYNHLMAWLAHMIQKPWDKTRIAPIFLCKKQQTGRGSFFGFFGNKVLGPSLYASIETMEPLRDQWTDWLVGILLLFIDELDESDSRDKRSWTKVKGYMTEATLKYNKRNVGRYTVENMMNIVMAGNVDNSIFVEEGDARLFPIRSNPEMSGNEEYFDKLHDLFENTDANDHFFTYLMRYKSEVKSLKKIPETKLAKVAKEKSKDPVHVFFEDYISIWKQRVKFLRGGKCQGKGERGNNKY